MLTSPVNVTIAATNGGGLKANTAASDNNARREPPLLPHHQVQAAEAMIEPELPSNSPLTNVNAMTATVGNRTVLQELTLNVATMLRVVRRTDENLTSLFLRVIAAIETMPQAERLQFEMRSGLKPLKITLADLVMALRKPDGPEAARLTATAEAPTTVPTRFAANAATTTYLEEGTRSGHTEEALAMRAAARNSAAGQSVFSAESKVRPADAQPADAKVLQNHLKVMFEPGETRTPAQQPAANVATEIIVEEMLAAEDASADPEMKAEPAAREELPNLRPAARPASGNAGEAVTFSSANLKLDPLTVEKIRSVAQAIANLAETVRADQERPSPDKVDDRRLQTMLTLKGLAEVVSAIPAKAAELLAAVVADAAGPLMDTADEKEPVATTSLQPTIHEEPHLDTAATPDAVVSEEAAAFTLVEEMPAEASAESAEAVERHQAEAAVPDERQTAFDFGDAPPPVRQDLAQHAMPFAYAQVQPAREERTAGVAEEETRGDGDEDGEAQGDEDDEDDRPRDEYDAIHDPVEEDEPAVVINRDSSEADRAFALYQRMGGF